MTSKEELISLIESWDEAEIRQAVELKKEDKTLSGEIEKRYFDLMRVVGGNSLRSLVNLPTKWAKLKNEERAGVLEHLPEGCPLFVDVVDLNAKLRVDAWRDSHYTHQIKKLPNNIGRFTNIKELYLKHQQLEQLPDSVGDLENLEVLDLEDNKLRKLPDWLTRLKKLRVLILKQNYGLKEAPDFGLLPNLEEIDLTYTDIDTLSDNFFQLKNLKKITTTQSDLDRNIAILRRIRSTMPQVDLVTTSEAALKIEDEDNSGENEYLGKEKIKIDEFNLNHLPRKIFAADVVKELEIRCYHLLELPDLFGNLQTLEKLHIKVGNSIETLPESLGALKNLKELSLEGSFKSLPESLGNLENLERLEVESWQLSQLPASFSRLTRLHRLSLKRTKIDSFARHIATMTQLEDLRLEDIGNNDYKLKMEVPLMGLTNLKEFKLETHGALSDDLFQLPPTLKRLEINCRNYTKKVHKFSLHKIINHFSGLEQLDLRGFDSSEEQEPLLPNQNLRKMLLHDVIITTIPDSFGNLKALKDLTMLSCGVTGVSAGLYDCEELEYCRLSYSKFATIPPGISKLKKLQCLGFEAGGITALPDDIFEMTNLKRLVMGECPLYSDKSFKDKIKRKIKGLKVDKSWY